MSPETTPVVFLPGLFDDVGMWTHQLTHLADVSRPVGIDLLEPETVADAADLVLSSAPPEFALVGFSMGGYVAFEIMRRAPERVAMLALVSTSARADSEDRKVNRLAQIARAEDGDYEAIVQEIMPNVVHPDRVGDTALMSELKQMALRVGAAAFVRQLRIIMSRPDSRGDLDGIDCSTLVICGRNDTLTPPELSAEMCDGISGARLALIEECNHYTPMERPHAVTALLRQWLVYS
jgi:pimeloyl-ACP methyl ester carboxylesterase